jgi:hypothetical protein
MKEQQVKENEALSTRPSHPTKKVWLVEENWWCGGYIDSSNVLAAFPSEELAKLFVSLEEKRKAELMEKYYTYEETLHPTPGMNPEKLELSKEFWFKDDDEELGEDELEYDLYENKTWSITSVDYVESLVV